jgi:hypothetical protein
VKRDAHLVAVARHELAQPLHLEAEDVVLNVHEPGRVVAQLAQLFDDVVDGAQHPAAKAAVHLGRVPGDVVAVGAGERAAFAADGVLDRILGEFRVVAVEGGAIGPGKGVGEIVAEEDARAQHPVHVVALRLGLFRQARPRRLLGGGHLRRGQGRRILTAARPPATHQLVVEQEREAAMKERFAHEALRVVVEHRGEAVEALPAVHPVGVLGTGRGEVRRMRPADVHPHAARAQPIRHGEHLAVVARVDVEPDVARRERLHPAQQRLVVVLTDRHAGPLDATVAHQPAQVEGEERLDDGVVPGQDDALRQAPHANSDHTRGRGRLSSGIGHGSHRSDWTHATYCRASSRKIGALEK